MGLQKMLSGLGNSLGLIPLESKSNMSAQPAAKLTQDVSQGFCRGQDGAPTQPGGPGGCPLLASGVTSLPADNDWFRLKVNDQPASAGLCRCGCKNSYKPGLWPDWRSGVEGGWLREEKISDLSSDVESRLQIFGVTSVSRDQDV